MTTIEALCNVTFTHAQQYDGRQVAGGAVVVLPLSEAQALSRRQRATYTRIADTPGADNAPGVVTETDLIGPRVMVVLHPRGLAYGAWKDGILVRSAGDPWTPYGKLLYGVKPRAQEFLNRSHTDDRVSDHPFLWARYATADEILTGNGQTPDPGPPYFHVPGVPSSSKPGWIL